jgi:hypothetical protein
MAAYIAFVACYPCNDKDVCADDKKKAPFETVVATHDHSSNELDQCSPFCICSCCSATINQPKYITFTFYSPTPEVFNSRIKPNAVKSIIHAIWQPPKVA